MNLNVNQTTKVYLSDSISNEKQFEVREWNGEASDCERVKEEEFVKTKHLMMGEIFRLFSVIFFLFFFLSNILVPFGLFHSRSLSMCVFRHNYRDWCERI